MNPYTKAELQLVEHMRKNGPFHPVSLMTALRVVPTDADFRMRPRGVWNRFVVPIRRAMPLVFGKQEDVPYVDDIRTVTLEPRELGWGFKDHLMEFYMRLVCVMGYDAETDSLYMTDAAWARWTLAVDTMERIKALRPY